jgi:sortase A
MLRKMSRESEAGMRHLKAKLALLTVLVCLAFASAAYALKPLIFRVEKTIEIEQSVEEFLETAEEAKQEAQAPSPSPSLPVKPAAYEGLLTSMRYYNSALFIYRQKDLNSKSAYEQSQFRLTDYGLPSETFGVISIPKISLEMPLFLGASEANMAKGAAVLSQTSIPIGGESTNAVIAGHRGWNGYKYFMDIERLEIGDEVTITNVWETLTYKVVDIQIVSPNDVGAILIQQGRDMITLLTCHPPNTGGRCRYLVFCERVKDENT